MATRRVSARRETVTIPTWLTGPADPNPPLRRAWGYWRTYPYPMLDELVSGREDREYVALVLENEYLRVDVFPEFGGHTYAHDKVAKRDIFYRPSTVKPALIALRGAWIAGGIEFNFPCSHNYLTFSPVDSRMVEHEDGSATIWFGAIEQVSRMRWAVGLTLRPGMARFETDIRLENRTPLPHRYYFWSNSAERVAPGTRFISPVTSVYGWGGIMRYPVHDGQYMPAYRDHRQACDMFSRNLQADFFGCYDDDAREGVVHVADRHHVRGRKYFTWGNSHDGLVWADILSDGAGPYIEIQSGPFETQSIFKLMEPHQVMRWQECWMGIRDTGGFEFANRDVVLNLVRSESGARLAIRATRRLIDATVTARAGDHSVGSWDLDVRPERVADLSLEPLGADERVHVVITTKTDGLIADAMLPWRGTEDPKTDPVPVAPDEAETVHGLLSRGIAHEQDFNWPAARECYRKALFLDPIARGPLVRLGILDLKAGPVEAAIGLLETAMRVFPDDAEVRYFVGCAYRAAGRDAEAVEAFWRARLSPQFGALGRYQLGEMAMSAGDAFGAAEHFSVAAGREDAGTKAWWALAVALRHAGDFGAATDVLERIAETDPLNPLAPCEGAFALDGAGRPAGTVRDALRALVRGETETWIELAADYAALGLYADACRLLDESEVKSPNALARYHRATYLRRMGKGDAARVELDRAAEAPSEYVFAHRAEEEPMLRAAIAENPRDANAPFYLATMLYMNGRTDDARVLWKMAAERGCTDASLHGCLAYAAWQIDHDRAEAERLYDRAISLRPDDHRLIVYRDTVREERGRSARERLDSLLALPEEVRLRGRIPHRLVFLHTAVGEHDAAIALLQSRRFDPWEGELGMRPLYVAAHVGKGETAMDAGDHAAARESFERALEYPTNVGVGKPYRSSDAPTRYRAGLACEATGDRASAMEHWRAGAAEDHHGIPSAARTFAELCRMKIGDATTAAANLGAIRFAIEREAKSRALTADEHMILARIARAFDDDAAAREHIADALRLAPDHAEACREANRLAATKK